MKTLKTSNYVENFVCIDIEMSIFINNYNVYCGTLSTANKYHRYKHSIYCNI